MKKFGPKLQRGYLMLLVLLFGSIFCLVLAAISGYSLSENRVEGANQTREQAFSVAEAGLEYYHWHLAHFPTDLQNGTGHAGPYDISIPDPEGGTAGTAELTITPNTACGVTTSLDLSSKGTAATDPTFPVTLVARYAMPSVAEYSYILNDSVWAGSDRVINGPYHSNGGIRMDGTVNAPVTSSVSTWSCTSDFGCSPTATKPGIFGTSTNSNLWSYPVPQVDFNAITANFSTLKSTAQSSGLYLPRYSSGNSNSSAYYKGYHLIFNSNGTVTIKRVSSVTSLNNVVPVNSSEANSSGYITDHTLINNETSYSTYTIPSNCGLIFVEDNVWVEGTIPSKVTVVSANVTNAGVTTNAILHGNITYNLSDGSDGLTLISQNDILIAPDSPTNMNLNGIFVAEGGAFGRNLYSCPGSYEPRGTLTIVGSTISNKRTGTKWENGCGFTDAGYQTRTDAFDRTLSTNPPPFTPDVSTDYEFVDWQQK